MVTRKQREQGLLLPDMEDIREVPARVAIAVGKEPRESGLGRLLTDEQLYSMLRKSQWTPHDYPYRPGPIGGGR